MTILLHQNNIEKVVRKLQQDCQERQSIRQQSEQEDQDFYLFKTYSKKNGKKSYRQPMNARSLYFIPIKSLKSHRQMQKQKDINPFGDGNESSYKKKQNYIKHKQKI